MLAWIRARPGIAVYAACQLVLLVWWAALYPGLMSYDSLMYVADSGPGHWSGAHSVLYNALIRISLNLTGDVGAITLIQTAVMSAALAYVVVGVHRLGVPLRWAMIAGVAAPVLPGVGSFTVTLWKDVPYTISIIFAVGVLIRLISERSRTLYGLLFVCLLGVGLFRNNGFMIVAFGAVPLGVVTLSARRLPWRDRLSPPLLGLAATVVSLAFIGGLYPALGVKPPPVWLAYNTAFSDIGIAYKDRPGTFTTADLQTMERVAPRAVWSRTANCHSVQPLLEAIDGKNFELEKASRASGDLIALWQRVLARTPGEIFQARICRGSIAWAIWPGKGDAAFKYTGNVPANKFGIPRRTGMVGDPVWAKLKSRPLSSTLHSEAESLLTWSAGPGLEWLLWRGATWCYVIYATVLACFAWAARSRPRRLVLMLGAVPLGLQLAVLANIPAQDARYMMPTLIIGLLLLPLLPYAVLTRIRGPHRQAGNPTENPIPSEEAFAHHE